MALEKIVATGVIRGHAIILDDSVPLPEGSRVILTVTLRESLQEQSFYAQLEADGLISLPCLAPEEVYQFEPLSVRGKPLSQMIIEERR